MPLEIWQFVPTFCGGGLAGALVNEYFRRRNSRVQKIPLVERVNRTVSPQLKDITLARVTQDQTGNRQLEEIRAVREYQFTLRNTSSIHLKDVEVLFEFPTEDVEGWADRPILSKTAPVPVNASTAEPWKKGFRWQIPNLPSTDSIEFGFKAINPPSGKYEASLYNSGQVVLQRSARDELRSTALDKALKYGPFIVPALGIVPMLWLLLIVPSHKETSSILNDAGCALILRSSYYPVDPSPWWPSGGPWSVYKEVRNIGRQNCIVQSELFSPKPVTIAAGGLNNHMGYTFMKPRLIRTDISFGSENADHKTQIEVFAEQN
jgi:hypothetical protein